MESYLLAWYFAGKHTSIDCFEKRKQKGFLFTVGDEPTLRNISGNKIKQLMGPGEYKDYIANELLEEAQKSYNVFHLHIKQTGAGSRQRTMDGWKELMGDNLIIVEDKNDVAKIIAETIIKYSATQQNPSKSEITQTKTETIKPIINL